MNGEKCSFYRYDRLSFHREFHSISHDHSGGNTVIRVTTEVQFKEGVVRMHKKLFVLKWRGSVTVSTSIWTQLTIFCLKSFCHQENCFIDKRIQKLSLRLTKQNSKWHFIVVFSECRDNYWMKMTLRPMYFLFLLFGKIVFSLRNGSFPC